MLFRILVLTILSSSAAVAAKPKRVHVDLEASSSQLARALKDQDRRLGVPLVLLSTEAEQLERISELGKRNLAWLKFINDNRAEPLKFTKPGSLGGIPVEKPQKYSGRLAIERLAKLKPTFLPLMTEVLLEGKPFTTEPPQPVEEYLKLGNEIDKVYQTALRWQLMQPHLWWYEKDRISDIRGYYFLRQIPDLQAQLGAWSSLTTVVQEQYREWLKMECFNSQADDAKCANEFAQAEASHTLWNYHQRYLPGAERQFAGLYELQNARKDVRWNAAQNNASLSIQPQSTQVLADFLTLNLQDEWKWNGWQLLIDFAQSAAIQVLWQPGVTPHVNGLGGDIISMDSNAPISEWDVQWTIRHEFGHSLGFPDCYVEFYDPKEKVMINYQIDISDLMCSRAGKLKERHFLDMKKNYASSGL